MQHLRQPYACTVLPRLNAGIAALWQDEAVDLLLNSGANPDLVDNDGCTPKQMARFHPHMLASMHQQQVQLHMAPDGSSSTATNRHCFQIQLMPSSCMQICICLLVGSTPIVAYIASDSSLQPERSLFVPARLGLSHPKKQSDDICIYAAIILVTKTWSAIALGVTRQSLC